MKKFGEKKSKFLLRRREGESEKIFLLDLMEDEEGHYLSKKSRKIHINYNNDPEMADFLDCENDFTQTQTQEDDFYEPNPYDEYIDEEPNASNTHVHFYFMFNLTFVA